MKKLLVICGPTATGKTFLAVRLAKRFKGEIISADSRQVYKGMDIGTGKDLTEGAELKVQNEKSPGYYAVNGTKIWGYDITDPKKGFSVGQYIKIARVVIDNIWAWRKLPILVGGTGLYIKGAVDGIPTAGVKPNLNLRKSLEGKTTEELFEILATSDAVKAASLNSSDRKNPRRLIRAIEVALQNSKTGSSKLDADVLFIGLSVPRKILNERIDQRVEQRIKSGMEKEIKALLAGGVKWGSQAMDALGYKQWEEYFKKPGKDLIKEIVETWKKEEHKYAKRQMTWFKKEKRINWFDITDLNFEKSVESLVNKWYSNGDV